MMLATPKQVTCALFDLDGTLVDTLLDVETALNRALVEAGAVPLPLYDIQARLGIGGTALIREGLARAGLQHSLEQINDTHQRYINLYHGNPCEKSRLYPCAAEVLSELRKGGVSLGLCTNKAECLVLEILKATGLSEAFDAIACADALGIGKPDPYPLQYLLKELGAEKETAVMIGDTDIDSQAAQAANIAFIHVSYGYGKLSFHNRGHSIEALTDLAKVLENLGFSRSRMLADG